MSVTPKPPVGVKGLDKYAIRRIRLDVRAQERKQFFRDVFIVPWGWDPQFYNLDGVLRGKEIPDFRYARYRALGWIRPLERPPYYELTCRGEQVYRDELDEFTDGSGDDDDWYDDDYDDDPY